MKGPIPRRPDPYSIDPTASAAPAGPYEALPAATAQQGYDPPPQWPRRVIGAALVAWVVLIGTALVRTSSDYLIAAIQMPVLALVASRMARHIERKDGDPNAYWFVMAAFAAKMLGAFLRFMAVTVLYSGAADASEYDLYGRWLAPHYRTFDFSQDVGRLSGTGFLRAVTGVVYAFFGPSKMGGYVIFAFLSFVGLLLLWRAFKVCVPEGDARRYGLLVLFLPSLVYWPSALGKDAWAVFALGLGSYGVARCMTRRVATGVPFVIAGVLAVSALRPHVALTMVCGMLLAAAVGKSRNPSAKVPLVRAVTFGALAIVLMVVVSQTSTFFGVDSLNQETVNATLAEAEGRTSEAASQFTPVRADNPVTAPLAVVTVLFRPFPFEAHNVQSLIGAAEGVFLMWLTWKSRRRLMNLWNQMRYSPYVAYGVGILITFIYAFSAFSNFGILARQRCQVMPFFLILLALPERPRKVRTAREEPTVETSAPPAPDPYGDQPSAADPYAQLREDRREREDPWVRFRADGSYGRGTPGG